MTSQEIRGFASRAGFGILECMKYRASIAALVAAALAVRAQYTPDEMLKPHVYTNAAGATLAYRMSAPQFPEPGKRYPLILFLHGSGECGDDNLKQIKVGLPALMASLLKRGESVIVVAPQCPSGSWWVKALARTPEYAASAEPASPLALTLELCRTLVAERAADPERLYITGLSLGGFGTWDAVQREPGMFAAAAPVCGGGDIRRVREIRRLPLWVFHGAEDKNVSVECSRRMVAALRQAGSRTVRYTEYEKAAHNVWDRAYADPELAAWLLKQKRAGKRPWWAFWEAF